jgi:hypothetical protein
MSPKITRFVLAKSIVGVMDPVGAVRGRALDLEKAVPMHGPQFALGGIQPEVPRFN